VRSNAASRWFALPLRAAASRRGPGTRTSQLKRDATGGDHWTQDLSCVRPTPLRAAASRCRFALPTAASRCRFALPTPLRAAPSRCRFALRVSTSRPLAPFRAVRSDAAQRSCRRENGFVGPHARGSARLVREPRAVGGSDRARSGAPTEGGRGLRLRLLSRLSALSCRGVNTRTYL
jgi:hypothetical protein